MHWQGQIFSLLTPPGPQVLRPQDDRGVLPYSTEVSCVVRQHVQQGPLSGQIDTHTTMLLLLLQLGCTQASEAYAVICPAASVFLATVLSAPHRKEGGHTLPALAATTSVPPS